MVKFYTKSGKVLQIAAGVKHYLPKGGVAHEPSAAPAGVTGTAWDSRNRDNRSRNC